MSSYLVVGGAGQNGHVLCQLLAQAGKTPVALDDLSTGLGDRVTHGALVKVDARQTPRVVRTLKEHGISTLIHSALASSAEDSLGLFEQNLTTTMSLLQALQETKGKKLFVLNPPPPTEEMLNRILADCGKAYGYQAQVLKGSPTEIVSLILSME